MGLDSLAPSGWGIVVEVRALLFWVVSSPEISRGNRIRLGPRRMGRIRGVCLRSGMTIAYGCRLRDVGAKGIVLLVMVVLAVATFQATHHCGI